MSKELDQIINDGIDFFENVLIEMEEIFNI